MCKLRRRTVKANVLVLILGRFLSSTELLAMTQHKESKKISNDQEPTQSDPTSCPINQTGNN